jgi:hypothetical protein
MENIEYKLKKTEYDENGLVKDIQYFFTESGGVDWKKMIPPQFLYVNNDPKNREKLEKKYNKPYEKIDPINDKVEDVDLIQTLGAAKYLLRLRGFTDIRYIIKESNENYAAVNCRIIFRGNYESLNELIPFEDNACATLNNTNGFGQRYLLEMATNRALVRCIRNACNIGIVNKEEIFSGYTEESTPVASNKQVKLLAELMDKKKIRWEHIVDKLKKENTWKETYASINDLEKDMIFQLIERIKAMPLVK